jgi:hypothetical protein
MSSEVKMRNFKKKKELAEKESDLLNVRAFVLTTILASGLEEITHYLFDAVFSLIKHLLGLQ